ncbi:MAG: twin-arginine translocation pathway signal, partial [Myxococcales bacterium]|nr:twin-arginine translocation pathway signal [Myxococcales bacterium]
GFIWGEARRAAQTSVGGSLHFAHSDLGGLALFEEANWHGVRAAEQALVGLGRTSPSWLEAETG